MTARTRLLANAPAYPCTAGLNANMGMTKRELIAATIMAQLANDNAAFPGSTVAHLAVLYADALIDHLAATEDT